VAADRADIVRELFAAFGRRDVEAALAVCDEATEFWPGGTAELTGRSEPYVGPEGMREYFADVARVWDELTVEPGELRVAGDGVVAFGTAHGRPAGTAETATIPAIWVFKLRGGKIASARVVATAREAEAVLRT
jgi:ketosteroid isomerase-like protein